MKRKLVKQGAATMMISLPSKWIKENKLGKGDEVDMLEENNSLKISLDKKKNKLEMSVSPNTEVESSLRVILTNVYRTGYDSIKIKFSNKRELDIIEDVVSKNLLGFEVISKSNNLCVIENITEPSADQFENIFNKLLLNIDELFSLLIDYKKGSDFETTERQVQRFDNFCRRVVSKTEFGYKANLRYSFHNELIHAQRQIYLILRYLSTKNVKLEKGFIELVKETKSQFDSIKKAYFEKDLSLLEKIHKNEKDLIYNKGYKLLKSTGDPILVYHLLSAIRNFYLSTSPLIGLVI